LDIFVDTGVVFGWSYDEDKFHSNAISFVRRFPFKSNAYYSTKNILGIEINKLKYERTNGITRRIRKIIQFFQIFYNEIKDVSCHNHAAYRHLRYLIYRLLIRGGNPKKDHDAIYLTNALIWDVFTKKLIMPHFITTDKTDIYEKKEDISVIGIACLNCKPRLTIEYLRNVAK